MYRHAVLVATGRRPPSPAPRGRRTRIRLQTAIGPCPRALRVRSAPTCRPVLEHDTALWWQRTRASGLLGLHAWRRFGCSFREDGRAGPTCWRSSNVPRSLAGIVGTSRDDLNTPYAATSKSSRSVFIDHSRTSPSRSHGESRPGGPSALQLKRNRACFRRPPWAAPFDGAA
jgi:hypothetical protein